MCSVCEVMWGNSITHLLWGNSRSTTGMDKLHCDFATCYNKRLASTVSHYSNK